MSPLHSSEASVNTSNTIATSTSTTTSTNVHPLQRQRSQLATSTATAASDMTRRMVSGGLAGMIAKTATNPLERLKMLSQTGEHGAGPTKLSASQLLRNILHKEGVLGLWAGNGANLLRVFPAKATVFASNDYYRGLLSMLQNELDHNNTESTTTSNNTTRQLSGPASFLAGGLSGMTATAVTYPLDFARGRISGKLAHRAGQKTYRGIVQTVVLTVQDEGMRALYRGVTPTMLGAMPYEGIKFGTVGLLESVFPMHPNLNDMNQSSSSSSSHLSTPVRKMLFGGVGGVMAGLITYPNDTVRRLLQLQGSRGTEAVYKGYWDCVRQTYQAHGIARFYHGLTINLIRMAPNTALQFYFYSLLKEWSGRFV